jgi:hypothetical protein
VSTLAFFGLLVWIDRAPLLERIEPYRRRLITTFLDEMDETGRPRYNLGLAGRAKKNWKSVDLVIMGCAALLANDSAGGNQVYLLSNDEDQAGDNLTLAKKLIAVNPLLQERLIVRQKVIERADGQGFLMILPAQDVSGAHGKTFRLVAFDEIHAYKTWDLLEAMQPDPTRPDAQTWITSYASIYHRPGIPLYDLTQAGRAGTDPRMLFSWYSADYTTDTDFADADPETRANPSRSSWADPQYLAQQQRRLPAHKYRRLHLNLPGLPDGSAFQVEPVADAITRGVLVRAPQRRDAAHEADGHAPPEICYSAFIDMSGGSIDDAVLAIAHVDESGESPRIVVDLLMNQGPPPPFDPREAVIRFAGVCAQYGITHVTGDAYAGETFRADFRRYGIEYFVAERSAHQLYEALEPRLNAREVVLPDLPLLEQQLLGLVWRGGRITHPGGEHDDFANALAGVVDVAARAAIEPPACVV